MKELRKILLVLVALMVVNHVLVRVTMGEPALAARKIAGEMGWPADDLALASSSSGLSWLGTWAELRFRVPEDGRTVQLRLVHRLPFTDWQLLELESSVASQSGD